MTLCILIIYCIYIYIIYVYSLPQSIYLSMWLYVYQNQSDNQPEPGCWAFRWHLESLGERGGGCGLVLLRKSTGNHHFYIVLASNTEVSCRFSLNILNWKQLCEDLDFWEIEGFGKCGWKRRVTNVSTRLWTCYWHLPGVWSLRWGLTWNRMIEYWTRDL